jgi:hypothetical protein
MDSLIRNLTSHFFNLPLSNYQSYSRFWFIPSHTSRNDEFQSSHPSESLIHPYDYLSCHNPILRWIGNFFCDASLHEFVTTSCIHELDFMISCDMVYVLTHDIFLLDLSLFFL